MSASSLYLETLSLAACGEMRWWDGGRRGAWELYEEATAANWVGVSSGWTRLVAVGMEVHGRMDMFERVSLGSHFLKSVTDRSEIPLASNDWKLGSIAVNTTNISRGSAVCWALGTGHVAVTRIQHFPAYLQLTFEWRSGH